MPDLAGRGPLGLKPPRPERGSAGKAHMARIAQRPCAACGKPGPSSVHHCISGRYGQRKASDMDTIPLCWECHQGPNGIHANKAAWQERHGPDYLLIPANTRRST